jgi:hypothetical protein
MLIADNFFFDQQNHSDWSGDRLHLLDADEWRCCLTDDCVSWELACIVYTNERSSDDIFSKSILLRVEYLGSQTSLDRERWNGMIETVEEDFSQAGYTIDLTSSHTPDALRAWKQWVITPQSPEVAEGAAR